MSFEPHYISSYIIYGFIFFFFFQLLGFVYNILGWYILYYIPGQNKPRRQPVRKKLNKKNL